MSGTLRYAVVLAVLLGAAPVVAQDAAPEPPALRLPQGVRVRVLTRRLPAFRTEQVLSSAGRAATVEAQGSLLAGVRVKGYLSRSELGRITIVPDGSDPFSPGEMTFTADEVERIEVGLERKRHWLKGLLVGAAIGFVVGLSEEVDPELCKLNDDVSCDRLEALALEGFGFSLVGIGIGALVQTQRWTPVELDALGPRPRRAARSASPLGVRFTVRF